MAPEMESNVFLGRERGESLKRWKNYQIRSIYRKEGVEKELKSWWLFPSVGR
jgi:hypothetical protein